LKQAAATATTTFITAITAATTTGDNKIINRWGRLRLRR
jgi:hypothetical protein